MALDVSVTEPSTASIPDADGNAARWRFSFSRTRRTPTLILKHGAEREQLFVCRVYFP